MCIEIAKHVSFVFSSSRNSCDVPYTHATNLPLGGKLLAFACGGRCQAAGVFVSAMLPLAKSLVDHALPAAARQRVSSGLRVEMLVVLYVIKF